MSTEGVTLREEHPGDAASIRSLVDDAFAPDATVGPLVEAIRASPRYVASLSLVAQDAAGAVVGFTMLSHVDLVGPDGVRREILSLSPLAVAPSAQGRGIGGALVRDALARATQTRESLVVLEGSPAYYPRFGFELAAAHGITINLPHWAPPEAAMAYLLPAHRAEVVGTVEYPPAFDEVVEH